MLLILTLLSGCEEKPVNNEIKLETKKELTIDEIWSLMCIVKGKERYRL